MTDQQYVAMKLNEVIGALMNSRNVEGPDRRLSQIAVFGHSDEQAERDGLVTKIESEADLLARSSRELAH
jgi:hypothetical protein